MSPFVQTLVFVGAAIFVFLAVILVVYGNRMAAIGGGKMQISLTNFSFKSFWNFIFQLLKIAVVAYGIYLAWYFVYGRQEVLVTHYLVAGIEGECNEDNAIGDITSFALRRWESERFTVPNGHRRCYYPLNQLEFKTQDRGRVHIVSLR